MQVSEILKKAQQKLVHSDSSRLDSEMLLCNVLSCERSHLYAKPEQQLSREKEQAFNKLIDLRSQGHPVAHLVNKKEFWSKELFITPDTLIPRPDTEVLVETALQLIPDESESLVLESGTGSGAIAIAIAAERSLANIIATDISDQALHVAKKNAAQYHLTTIIFKKSDWFENLKEKRFDFILSNPPYIANNDPHLQQGDVRFEPISALVSGEHGLDDLTNIIKSAKKYLNEKGKLVVEHGYQQGTAVRELFSDLGYNHVSTVKDYNELERVTWGQV